MDFSKFKTSTWLMVGGAIAMIIGGNFLDWGKVSIGGFSESAGTAFDWNRGKFSWFLVVAVGVAALLGVLGKLPKSKMPINMILLAASAVSAILMITLIISSPEGDGMALGEEMSVDTSWAIGAYIATAAAIAATVGAFMEFTAGGGNIKDLADTNKWKGDSSSH